MGRPRKKKKLAKTLEDLIYEEDLNKKRKVWKEKTAGVLKDIKDRETYFEKRFNEFVYAFNHEWRQIAFMLLHYAGKPAKASSLKHATRKLIPNNPHIIRDFRYQIQKFVDVGYIKKEKSEEVEYSLTKKGREFALPRLAYLMEWNIDNKVSARRIFGCMRPTGGIRPSFKARILRLVNKYPPKEFGLGQISKKIGLKRESTSRLYLTELKKDGLIEYDSYHQNTEKGKHHYIWNRGSDRWKKVKEANEDERVLSSPKRLKPKITERLCRKGDWMCRRDFYDQFGEKYKHEISTVLAGLCTYGYSTFIWGKPEHRSAASITSKGEEASRLIGELKYLGTLDKKRIPSYNEFKIIAKDLLSIMGQYSSVERIASNKEKVAIEYLKDGKKRTKDQIHKQRIGITSLNRLMKKGVVIRERVYRKRKADDPHFKLGKQRKKNKYYLNPEYIKKVYKE
ncbi:helix-turn-helix domain-containing protein [Nanoarchaeota archaeon]